TCQRSARSRRRPTAPCRWTAPAPVQTDDRQEVLPRSEAVIVTQHAHDQEQRVAVQHLLDPRKQLVGAGQEVGRSCIILEFKGRKMMLDCGIHPGLEGMDALLYIDLIDPAEIDLLLISHFHLDHCGALPWFLQKTSFKGRTFMTHATKAIYRWLLSDYVKVSNISADDMLYTETDLEESMDKIETINFHEVKEFWCYHAGHVLGAAMFMIEIAGVKLLYTGDFSRQEDRHLMAAEIPVSQPMARTSMRREEREARFCNTVHNIVNREGRCLIPVFALGRAQELLLILDEYWQNHPELHDIPIYYASSLAKKCMAVYQTYVNAMNDKIRKAININNPFVFKHISNLKSMDHFDDIGPSVHIKSEPEEITTMSGQKLQLKMSVDYISFSAHLTTSRPASSSGPSNHTLILVHGEQNEMARLKAALIREYEDTTRFTSKSTTLETQKLSPSTSEERSWPRLFNWRFPFLKSLWTSFGLDVMGSLADEKCFSRPESVGHTGEKELQLPHPQSLRPLHWLSTVKQTQAIPFTGPYSLLVKWKSLMERRSTLKIFKNITLIHEAGMVLLEVSGQALSCGPAESYAEEQDFTLFSLIYPTTLSLYLLFQWLANPLNDMYADAVTTVVLEVQSNPKAQKAMETQSAILDMEVFQNRLGVMLHDGKNVSLTVDGKTVHICLETRVRSFKNDAPKQCLCCTIVVISLTDFFSPNQSVCYEDESTEDDS
ncbi:hypothetical protein F7725_008073, partial [Dissostichus mawsoni]